ncbi:Transcription termination factor Rho [Listeria fleischmannii subsp. fleischmannii]|uniref:Transcription termination factor Rho n=1 Tax=Listeria fleischmannii subsp. fleischmannii TaxID=1671902 RepID=A0A2X3GPW4_9LIST|nr:Transcription termination factor Rho [Listeria fleischmannii subsp. fleischmannii]
MAKLSIAYLESLTIKEIYELAKEHKIAYYSKLTKKELIFALLKSNAEKEGFFFMEGVLDIIPSEGFGFLRPINYSASSEDIYISASQIRRFDLRTGDKVSGKVRPPKENERYFGLLHVEAVNGENPEVAKERVHFPGLTPLYPDKQMMLETGKFPISMRMIDMVAPIGFGQRGLIVAPPKAGKTILLKEIANAITTNHPEAELIVLLIDERPEEVTDIERSVSADVASSTFDEVPENHIKVAELVLERAMRLVEQKRDVIILMDSITRLARAYNLVIPRVDVLFQAGLTLLHSTGRNAFLGRLVTLKKAGA